MKQGISLSSIQHPETSTQHPAPSTQKPSSSIQHRLLDDGGVKSYVTGIVVAETTIMAGINMVD